MGSPLKAQEPPTIVNSGSFFPHPPKHNDYHQNHELRKAVTLDAPTATGARPQDSNVAPLQTTKESTLDLKRSATVPHLPYPLFDPTAAASKEENNEDDSDGRAVDVALSDAESDERPSKNDTFPQPPYHVFSRQEKWLLVWIVSFAGLFSPLSSNIYFPALGAISAHVQAEIAMISLTVTVYMAVQGVAPSFWGPLSDTRGRRVTFICTFVVYLIANISLAFSNNFASLMAFRAIQAAGSAATISVGAGVIGDITTAKERGGFMGSFGGIRMLGQSIGPVIGGIITEFFGFHAIFWFLVILGFLSLAMIVLFLPETLRHIAGNGTIPLRGIHRPLVFRHISKHWVQPGSPSGQDGEATVPSPRFTLRSVLSPLQFLFEKDVFVTLLFGAFVYTIWSMVTSSTTALFQPRYQLSNLQVGLIFLPNGAACVSGSYFTGRILDHDYRHVESAYRVANGVLADIPLSKEQLSDLPISRARLRSSWYFIVLFVLAVAGYGVSLSSPSLASKPGMALPLMLQFIIAFTATAIFTQNSALMVDLCPGAIASATAVNNLVRCSLGAVGVAGVQFIIEKIGVRVTFLIFAVVTICLAPLMGLQWKYGEIWRARRIARLARRVQQQAILV
ncbi:major facilitator superfamily domain-containing protein [Triangularia verruculosa]|uniref:Major facilitator superfamily domain-containing protein n=1 Tax=Triangularia verruculosa TaxID=2587418 RepID=A0AAN7AZH6_9PEZI|nr:major facilitator superfamily domain-containing protein [Triangularia verruculosa]